MPAMPSVYRIAAKSLVVAGLIWIGLCTVSMAQSAPALQWKSLPPIPDELGLAGPVVGVHDDVLIVGGGANFARPVWDNLKRWHDRLYGLDLRSRSAQWHPLGHLPARIAYSACASTPWGVAILGGNDEKGESAKCWMLQTQREADGSINIKYQPMVDLPHPLVYAQALWIDNHLVVMSGQSGSGLGTSISSGWQLKLPSSEAVVSEQWQPITACPGVPRAFAMMSALPKEHSQNRFLLMGGRHQVGERVEFLDDVWQYDMADNAWQQLASLPVPVTAGGAGVVGRYVAVVSGDDGRLFTQTDLLRDQHPGFAKRTWLFDMATGRWQSGGASPANQVTTPPVTLPDRLIIASGEVRPRVRTNQVWQINGP